MTSLQYRIEIFGYLDKLFSNVLGRPDPLYEAIFTCTGNPVRSIGTQAQVSQEEENQTFTAMNSFWFILAALLGQGVDILPK